MEFSLLATAFWLLAGHAVADFWMQTDSLRRDKKRGSGDRQTLWPIALAAHGLHHGAVVGLVTESIGLGALEAVLHAAIDYGKSEGWYGTYADQGLHIACKGFYLWWWATMMVG